MAKNIIKFTILLGLLFCSCQKEMSDKNSGAAKVRLPLNEVIRLETRDPVLLELFPENSLSPEDRESLLLLMKWSDLYEPLDYPERIKHIVIQYNEKITDKDLQFLEHFPNLEELYLAKSYNITDEGMSVLRKLPHLIILSVADTRVTEASLPLIAELKNLETLYLGLFPFNRHPVDSTESPWKDQLIGFSDNALKYLKNSNIKNLWFMSPTNISDDGLQYINTMRHLRKIFLMSNVITREGVEKWIPTISDQLTDINISVSQPTAERTPPEVIRTDNATIILSGLKKEIPDNNLGAEKTAESIRLPLTLATRDPELLEQFPENSLSPEDREALLLLIKWSDLGQSLDYPERIKKIDIQRNEKITDKDLQFLERFPNLEELTLDGAYNITDEGMSILKKLPHLEYLSLSGTQVTETSLPLIIAELKNLQVLDLGALPANYSLGEDIPPQFSDTSMNLLKNSNLEALFFSLPTSITCDGLQLITSMKNLKELYIRTNNISFKDIKRVEKISFPPKFEYLMILQEGPPEKKRISKFRIKNVRIFLSLL
jgi:hypothetical protein